MVVDGLVKPVLAAFDEDQRAAWVPDVAAGIDAEGLFRLGTDSAEPIDGTVEWLTVPKPDGTSMNVPLLSLPWLAALHKAVAPFKPEADRLLGPGVCGYRLGAEPGLEYSREHRRFSEIVAAEAGEAGFVVSADVRKFFASTSWLTVLDSAQRLLSSVDDGGLRRLVDSLTGAGLSHLPAGYADARFLANLVLVEADEAIGLPFARWVDDYRIFAPDLASAEAALARLAAALDKAGLSLNSAKARTQTSAAYLAGCSQSFTSVYHPEFESPEVVRTELRKVFLAAAADPAGHRRSIRFVLPRLAAEGDPIAVPWVFEVLRTIPWEAPRLLAYLSAFVTSPDVPRGVEASLVAAFGAGDEWLASRLAALACSTGLSDETASLLSGFVASTESPSVWSLSLRALALSGHHRAVQDELDRRVLDVRSAVVLRRDLGEALQAVTTSTLPMVCALKAGPAPVPSLESIL